MKHFYEALVNNPPYKVAQKIDRIIDASGLACPTHVIKAKATFVKMTVGEVVQFVSTDRGCLFFIPRLVKSMYGLQILSQYEEKSKYVFVIRKNE